MWTVDGRKDRESERAKLKDLPFSAPPPYHPVHHSLALQFNSNAYYCTTFGGAGSCALKLQFGFQEKSQSTNHPPALHSTQCVARKAHTPQGWLKTSQGKEFTAQCKMQKCAIVKLWSALAHDRYLYLLHLRALGLYVQEHPRSGIDNQNLLKDGPWLKSVQQIIGQKIFRYNRFYKVFVRLHNGISWMDCSGGFT